MVEMGVMVLGLNRGRMEVGRVNDVEGFWEIWKLLER